MEGMYKITLESIKNVDLQRKTYTYISGVEKQHIQGYEQFFHLIDLSDDADYLLVDIRKFEQPDAAHTGTFSSCIYKLYNANMLRHHAQLLQHDNKRLALLFYNYFNPEAAFIQKLTYDNLYSLQR